MTELELFDALVAPLTEALLFGTSLELAPIPSATAVMLTQLFPGARGAWRCRQHRSPNGSVTTEMESYDGMTWRLTRRQVLHSNGNVEETYCG